MQTIITPTDFSDVSLNAVNYAADMAIALHTKLLILHATEIPAPAGVNYAELTDNEIEKKLDTLKKDLLKRSKKRITVQTKQVTGFIENEIIAICDYQNPLAVIMATQGANFREHFFVGSITVYLSKNLKYPVIAVPKNVSYKPINKILLATDLENLYDLSIEKIVTVTKAFNATLDIVHVYKNEDKLEVMKTRKSELAKYLKDLASQFHFIKSKNVYEAITNFAQKNNSDLILAFPKKHVFFHRSESKQLIYNSPFAVMTIQ
jgi:nucleotide-binding universal stress UspA family protein